MRRDQYSADLKAMKQSTENQFDSYLMVSNSHSAHCLLCFIRQIFCHFSSKAKQLIWTFGPFGFGTTTKCQEGAVGHESVLYLLHIWVKGPEGKKKAIKTHCSVGR